MMTFTAYWALWRCRYGESTWMMPVRVISPPREGIVEVVPKDGLLLQRVDVRDIVGIDNGMAVRVPEAG